MQEEFLGAIGIDLGTTYSCVAVFTNNQAEVIPNSQGNRITPSCVAFHNSEILVGDSAKQLESRGTKGVIYDAKRMIGRRYNDVPIQEDKKAWPFEITEGENGRILISLEHKGEPLTLAPEEISAQVLIYLKECAEKYLGKRVGKAVITVPAYFSDAQRERTRSAATIAGLEPIRIVNEPTAAVLSYGLGVGGGNSALDDATSSNVLVFDFGGGTFDVSIITIHCGSFAVRATAGDTHLGGQDVDSILLQYVLSDIKQRFNKDLASNPRLVSKIRASCEHLKRTLSHTMQAEIALDGILDNGEEYILGISRAKMEELCSSLFSKCMDVVKRALKDAGMTTNDISELVLVGGSSRIPKLHEMLREHFKKTKLCSSVHPDEAVAIGAAIQASILSSDPAQKSEKTSNVVLMDVVPLSIGVEVDNGKFDAIIKRNTTIPYKAVKEYSTVEDYQEVVDIQVFEGERPLTKHNHKLGEFSLEGVTKEKKGKPTITVTFSVDADGLLTVSACESLGKNSKSLTVQNSERLSDSEVNKMMETASRFAEEDAISVAIIEKEAALREAFHELDETISEIPLPLSEKMKKRMAFMEHGKEWLDKQIRKYSSVSELEIKTSKIQKLLRKALRQAKKELKIKNIKPESSNDISDFKRARIESESESEDKEADESQ